MVHFTSLLSAAALYSTVAFAAPRPDMPMADSGMATTSAAAMMAESTMMMDSSSSAMMMDSSSSTMMADQSTMMMDSSSTMMMDQSTMMMESSTMMMDSSSTMMMDSSSTMMMESSSTMMMAPSSTMMMEASSTSAMTMATATYGSGSSNWGSSYDSCVQQCVAQYGAPAATYTPTATATQGSSGTGATHTIIVAPSQGVLRYVPFAVNASVGDTIKFMWGANGHTATKGSALELCNKTSDAPFASGLQNKSFVFEQVVNDTKPTFFYCAAPTHCQKGMFGIINPAVSTGAPTSAAVMMNSMAQNMSDMAAMDSYTTMKTAGSKVAATWGANIDFNGMPDWSLPLMAQNIQYTRTMIAANQELVTADGGLDLGAGNGAPMVIPPDITVALNAAAGGAAAAAVSAAPSASAPAAATSASAAPATSQSAAPTTNGAGSVAASSALVGLIAVVATLFAL